MVTKSGNPGTVGYSKVFEESVFSFMMKSSSSEFYSEDGGTRKVPTRRRETVTCTFRVVRAPSVTGRGNCRSEVAYTFQPFSFRT
jgi:hypothetical protein